MTKKQALQCSAFFALIILLVGSFSYFLRDRTTTLSSFYSEANNSIDAIVVGSSHVNSTYIPATLWQEYDISAHNVFSWSQPMWISYHYIKEALRTQDVKLIVLEMYGMMYGNSYIMPEEIDSTNYKNSFSIDPGTNYLEMLQTVKSCGIDLRQPKDFLNIIRYHSRWKEIEKSFFTYNPHNDHSENKGYGYIIEHSSYPQPNIIAMNSITATRKPYEKSVEYLNKIVQLAKEKGIELLFTMSPYVYTESEVEIFNWISSFAQREQIPFLNYNLNSGIACGFDYATDLSDSGHTNYYGADKITRHLGAFIAENYDIARTQDFIHAEHLTQDSDYMYRTFYVNQYFTIATIAEYLEQVSNDENLDLYFVSGSEGFMPSEPKQLFTQQELNKKAFAAYVGKFEQQTAASDNSEDVLLQKNYNEVTLTIRGSRIQCTEKRGQLDLQLDFIKNGFTLIVFDKELNKLLETVIVHEDGTIVHREILSEDFTQ